jgi:hypothetical protein
VGAEAATAGVDVIAIADDVYLRARHAAQRLPSTPSAAPTASLLRAPRLQKCALHGLVPAVEKAFVVEHDECTTLPDQLVLADCTERKMFEWSL